MGRRNHLLASIRSHNSTRWAIGHESPPRLWLSTSLWETATDQISTDRSRLCSRRASGRSWWCTVQNWYPSWQDDGAKRASTPMAGGLHQRRPNWGFSGMNESIAIHHAAFSRTSRIFTCLCLSIWFRKRACRLRPAWLISTNLNTFSATLTPTYDAWTVEIRVFE